MNLILHCGLVLSLLATHVADSLKPMYKIDGSECLELTSSQNIAEYGKSFAGIGLQEGSCASFGYTEYGGEKSVRVPCLNEAVALKKLKMSTWKEAQLKAQAFLSATLALRRNSRMPAPQTRPLSAATESSAGSLPIRNSMNPSAIFVTTANSQQNVSDDEQQKARGEGQQKVRDEKAKLEEDLGYVPGRSGNTRSRLKKAVAIAILSPKFGLIPGVIMNVFHRVGKHRSLSAKTVSGWISIPLVISFYSSSFPVMKDIMARKSTDRYAFAPYLLLWGSCFTWVIYSIHIGIAKVYEAFTVNCYGVLVNTCALAIYYRNMSSDNPDKKRRFRRICVSFILSLAAFAGVSFGRQFHDCSDPNSLRCWWGKLTMFLNIVLFGGPFAAFKDTWTTKSVKYLPLMQPITGLACSINAVVYFCCLRDANGLIPNVCGIALSAAQIAFRFFIKFRYPQGDRKWIHSLATADATGKDAAKRTMPKEFDYS